MTREFKISYDWHGARGSLFICTLSRSGAIQLFKHHFPKAIIVRISEAKS